MPTAYVRTLAEKGKGTVQELEHKWDRAVDLAADQGHAEDYAYITGIFNRMIGKKKKSAAVQELVNYDTTGRMGMSAQRFPGHGGLLYGGLSRLSSDQGEKGGSSQSPNFMDGSLNMGNIVDNGTEVKQPEAVPGTVDKSRKDLVPGEVTKEEREAERTADASFGSQEHTLVKKMSALEWIRRMCYGKTAL